MTHGPFVDFLYNHAFYFGVGAFWLYSAIVSSMPEATSASSQGYLWAFNVLHTIAGNLSTAFGDKIPGYVKPVGKA